MNSLKKQRFLFLIALPLIVSLSACLKSGYKELANSSSKDLTAVTYSYRFLYNDTIKKGTALEEIEKDRVCEVVFTKTSAAIQENGMKGFVTTINHNINSVMKAGPTGSVTKQMLYDEFKKRIANSLLNELWVSVTISDVAKITPQNGAPTLGTSGNFSQDRIYRVTASDGSYQDYIIRTVKGF